MRRGVTLVMVLAAALAGLRWLPLSWSVPLLLVLMFVLGWILPDHPVAVATVWYGLSLLASLVTLVVVTECWWASGCGFFYPLNFDLAPVLLMRIAEVFVYLFVGWGWMVVSAYMGAGMALRLRHRQAA